MLTSGTSQRDVVFISFFHGMATFEHLYIAMNLRICSPTYQQKSMRNSLQMVEKICKTYIESSRLSLRREKTQQVCKRAIDRCKISERARQMTNERMRRDGKKRSDRIKFCPVSQPSYMCICIYCVCTVINGLDVSSYIIHVHAQTQTRIYTFEIGSRAEFNANNVKNPQRSSRIKKKEFSLKNQWKKHTACTHTQWINNKSTTTATNFFFFEK